ITGMACLKGDTDLAIGLKATDPRAMAGTRTDDDERPPFRIDFDSGGRDNPYERIIHRPIERSAVDDKLGLIVENIRCRLREMFAILISALSDHVPKQDAALRRVDQILDYGAIHVERPGGGFDRL